MNNQRLQDRICKSTGGQWLDDLVTKTMKMSRYPTLQEMLTWLGLGTVLECDSSDVCVGKNSKPRWYCWQRYLSISNNYKEWNHIAPDGLMSESLTPYLAVQKAVAQTTCLGE